MKVKFLSSKPGKLINVLLNNFALFKLKCSGSAMVEMRDVDNANRVLRFANSMMLFGSRITVKPSQQHFLQLR